MYPPDNLDSPEPSEFQERIQRIMNDKKRKELEEKFGASFHKGDAELPADVEADWLEQLETFEEQMENAERVPIRQYIGNPTLRPPAAVPADEIASELAQALDLLAAVVEHASGGGDRGFGGDGGRAGCHFLDG